MPDDDSNSFQRETLVDNQLLHTEYQEVNQEFRHRNQLLQNTFYLLIIAAGVFLGLFIRFGSGGNTVTLSGLIIASGVVATILGHLFLKHFHERSSAEAVRMHAEWVANGRRQKAERALSLEWGVAGGGAMYDEEKDCIVRRGSHVHYLTKWPGQLLSAEFFGLFLIYTGAASLIGGVTLVSSTISSGLLPYIVGGASVLIILSLYGFARSQAKTPTDESIY